MKKVGKVLVVSAIVLATLLALGLGTLVLLVTTDIWVSFDPEKLEKQEMTTLILDREGQVVSGVYSRQNRIYVEIEDIPKEIQNVFLAAEDLRFYKHRGVDVIRIFGAALANIKRGSLSQGASTITQQLVKNTHLTNDKTWSRKIKEAILALQVERQYSKDEILEMYLNYVYFGNGAYGVQTASYAYFGKSVAALDVTEAAALAAALKAPSNYAPHIQPENNKKRRNLILSTMEEEGMLSPQQAQAARAETIQLAEEKPEQYRFGWYMDAVLAQAEDILQLEGEELLMAGYRITTALDQNLQAELDALFSDPALFPDNAKDGTLCQSAVVVMDSRTGDVLALEGGREYTVRRGINRVTDMRRQPGSALKPLAVYVPALERRIVTPTTVFFDQPTDFDGYQPKNFGGKYYGAVTLRGIAARSLNVPTVQLLSNMGAQTGYESLLRFHLDPEPSDNGLSLGVGSMRRGVTPLSLCAAYAALGNGGQYHEPSLITHIETAGGQVLYEREAQAQTIVDPAVSFVTTSLLQSAAQWGTAKRLGAVGLPIAAKTGTADFESGRNRDAWTAAYTPEIAMVCWMGFDHTDTAHALPSSITGGTLPAALLAKLLEKAEVTGQDFVQPEGVSWVKVDKRSLERVGPTLLASPYTPEALTSYECYLTGTEPTGVDSSWNPPAAPWDFQVARGTNGLPEIRLRVLQNGVLYHLMRMDETGQEQEIGLVTGNVNEVAVFTDQTAQRSHSYTYYAVPEFAETGIRGPESSRILYAVPLLPFSLPPFWEDDWEDELPQQNTPAPSVPLAPSASSEPNQPSVPTALPESA